MSKFASQLFEIFEIANDRYFYSRTTSPRDVAHPQPEHQARAEGEAMAVAAWLPISTQREIGSWKAGYRDAEIPHGYFRERVLLARPRGGTEDGKHRTERCSPQRSEAS